MTRSFPFARWMLPARAPAYLALLALALAFSLPARPSLSHEVEIDGRKISFDPAQIRYITPTSATSDCIGNPTTPLCAIDTMVACTTSLPNPGCRLMHYHAGPQEKLRVEYVIVKAGFVNHERLGKIFEEAFPWLTVDSYQARVIKRICKAGSPTCEGEPWIDRVYDIAPKDGIWTFSAFGLFIPDEWFVD